VLESEADRLAMIKSLGGEPFTTALPDKLWGIFDREYEPSEVGGLVVANRQTVLQCRESDVELHKLVVNSVIKRDADGKSYSIKTHPEHDGTGMTVLPLSK
jgi:hypothetical protein